LELVAAALVWPSQLAVKFRQERVFFIQFFVANLAAVVANLATRYILVLSQCVWRSPI
jgi:hypothetical protein